MVFTPSRPTAKQDDSLDYFVQLSRKIRPSGSTRPVESQDRWVSMARDFFGENFRQQLIDTPRLDWAELVRPAADPQIDAAAQIRLGITTVAPSPVVELRPNASESDLQTVLRAVYKQLFGNTYILESDRLTNAESLLRNGTLSVREFVRALAKSELYKNRFFNCTSNNRFIELNFKHFLGRAPYSQSEIAEHFDCYHTSGYEAEVDSYIDSDEYRETFRESIVPYFRGFKYQVSQAANVFENFQKLYKGPAGSDTDRTDGGQTARLITDLAAPKASAPATRYLSNDTALGSWLDMARDLMSAKDYASITPEVNTVRLPDWKPLSVPSKEARIDAQAQISLGITTVAPAPVVELRLPFDQSDVEVVIRAVYKQVFGNTYIFECDRQILSESLLRNGTLTVREFVRALAKSDLYKSRFFDSAFNDRFIELNFKHLLGRAPYSKVEIREHFNCYCNKGFDAEIDSYIDSDEYRDAYGESVVPYFRGFKYQVSQAANVFDNFQKLYNGPAGSDTDRNRVRQKAILPYNLAKTLPEVLNFGAGPKIDHALDSFIAMARTMRNIEPSPAAPTDKKIGGFFERPAAEARIDAEAQISLGITAVAPAPVFELRPNASESDLQTVLRAVYKQLFGNTYILESDRLTSVESLLRNGTLTVREFVRALAKSELYKNRFFNCTSNNRFIELNFKHFLGRAPYNQSEIAEHFDRYHKEGYEAEVDSYIDSDEYRDAFGESIVPYFRSFKYQVAQTAAVWERSQKLYSGFAGSDTDRTKQGQMRLVDPVELLRSGRGIL
jgi:Phycobilisome Linker polypeptide